jgi:hypothetical protein
MVDLVDPEKLYSDFKNEKLPSTDQHDFIELRFLKLLELKRKTQSRKQHIFTRSKTDLPER